MPELKPLPCPACGGTNAEPMLDEDGDYFILCRSCGMRGPATQDTHSAIIDWDSLPRAMRWTHEPPKVAGWYWCRQQEDDDRPWVLPRIVKITNTKLTRSDYWQYAGPIPAPLD